MAIMLVTLGSYSVFTARSESTDDTRSLVFGKGIWAGQVYVRARSEPGDRKWVRATEGWRYLSEARGRIDVPAKMDLMLRTRDRDLSYLQPLGVHAFAMIDCSGVGLSDEDAEHLKYAPKVRALNLARNPDLSDRCLAHLTEHEDMAWLNLDQTGISGSLVSANAFSHMEKLEYFSANQSPFEDRGMAHLGECVGLKVLLLADTQITLDGTRFLSGLRQLETLNLAGAPLGVGAMSALSGALRLRYLDLSGTRIDDREIQSLSRLKELRFVNLDRTPITDAALPVFLACERLQQVSVKGTRITIRAFPERPFRGTLRIIHARANEPGAQKVVNDEG